MRKRSWPAVSHCSFRVSRCCCCPSFSFERGGGIQSGASRSSRRVRSSGFSAYGLAAAGEVSVVFGNAYEVNADRGDVGLGVGVVGEPQEQARLSDTGVSDEEELEEIVVSGVTLEGAVRKGLAVELQGRGQ